MTRPSMPRPDRDLFPMLAASVVGATVFAPWVLGFASSRAAVATHIAFAMTFGPIALLIAALSVAAWSTGVAGGALVLAPWVIGYASAGVAAWGVDLVAGLLLVGLSLATRRAGTPAAERTAGGARPARTSERAGGPLPATGARR
jgi:hypothetical protein